MKKFVLGLLSFVLLNTAHAISFKEKLCAHFNNDTSAYHEVFEKGFVGSETYSKVEQYLKIGFEKCVNLPVRIRHVNQTYIELTKDYSSEGDILLLNYSKKIDKTFYKVNLSLFKDFELSKKRIKSQGIELETLVGLNEKDKSQKTTILIRSPYLLFQSGVVLDWMNYYIQLGLNIVYQSVEGSSMSEGEFEWLNWKKDAKNTTDSVDWIIKQPWSNGKVVLAGNSYSGYTSLAGATTNHPAIVAVLSGSAPTNPQTDSLSKGSITFELLGYEFQNRVSVSDESMHRLFRTSGLNKTMVKQSQLLPLYEKIYGSVSSNNKKLMLLEENKKVFSSNDDLVNKLKEVEMPVFLSYGKNYDQDSGDVIRLIERIGPKNNYFIHAYPKGHDNYKQLDMLNLIATMKREVTRESVQDEFEKYYKNTRVVESLVLPNGDVVESFVNQKMIDGLFYTKTVTTRPVTDKNGKRTIGVELPVGTILNGHIKGTVKFVNNKKKGNYSLTSYFYLCSKMMECQSPFLSNDSQMVISGSERNGVKSFSTNSLMIPITEKNNTLVIESYFVGAKDHNFESIDEEIELEITFQKSLE